MKKHGLSHSSKLYNVWNCMVRRCHKKQNPAYERYGGRGITVCERWQHFPNFLADMGERPAGYTLERIDNNKGYTPDNCRWASRAEQGRNKRNNVLLCVDGETLPLSVWAERYGLKYQTLHQRILQGWTAEAAVKTPLITKRKGIPRGQKLHAWGIAA